MSFFSIPTMVLKQFENKQWLALGAADSRNYMLVAGTGKEIVNMRSFDEIKTVKSNSFSSSSFFLNSGRSQ